MTDKFDDKKEILAIFDRYIQAYFIERDPGKTFALLDAEITGFGTGIDEIARESSAFKKLYLRDFEQAPGRIDVEFNFTDVDVISAVSGVVSSVFSIKTVISGQPVSIEGLRLSLMLYKNRGTWKISHMHISLPARVHEEGESYPLKELEERNRLLEQMVKEKTSELEIRNKKLEEALLSVRQLRGLLPICASCKKIRDDEGYWHQIEEYLRVHSEAEFSHSLCPDCKNKMLSELSELKKKI
ncbi:MAG TPA: nuclear transport factor 2 family protein [Spirochaetota bacterium]|nr:nuclear transport factor 2 family protein [Spirochaetota bacterium]HRX46597.1 nuclear transport factor 2 family protein [Spirochaetota bacterium]